MRRSDGCLLTAYDQGYRPIADLCVPTLRTYAERHRLDFYEAVDMQEPRGPNWIKMGLTLQRFDEGYDFVFWVDADAYFHRFDADIRDVLEAGGDFYFGNEDHIPAPPGRKGRLNAGVYVMLNTPIVRQFLHEVNRLGPRPDWPWHDQSAMHHVFGFESMRTGRFDMPDPIHPLYVDRLRWLPTAWNSGVGYDRVDQPIIRHFYGGEIDEKQRLIAFILALDRQLAEARVDAGTAEDLIYDAYNRLASGYQAALRDRNREIRQLRHEGHALRAEIDEARRELDRGRERVNSRSWLFRQLLDVVRRKTLGQGA